VSAYYLAAAWTCCGLSYAAAGIAGWLRLVGVGR
jgi:hypothetical protein